MKLKVFSLLALLCLATSTAHAVDEIGPYDCANQSKITAVYTATQVYSTDGATKKSDHFALKDLKKVKPQKGCYYGEIAAGAVSKTEGVENGETCFIVLTNKSMPIDKAYAGDAFHVQCVLQKEPNKVLGGMNSLHYYKSHKLLKGDEWHGVFQKDLSSSYGTAVCIGAEESGDKGYNDHAFCEVLAPEKGKSGRRARAATVNFKLNSAAGNAASAVSTPNTKTPSTDDVKKANPLGGVKKKLGF